MIAVEFKPVIYMLKRIDPPAYVQAYHSLETLRKTWPQDLPPNYTIVEMREVAA